MKIRFIYFNKITKQVESIYVTMNDFNNSNESFIQAENLIFKKLYENQLYNNEIQIIQYRILN